MVIFQANKLRGLNTPNTANICLLCFGLKDGRQVRSKFGGRPSQRCYRSFWFSIWFDSELTAKLSAHTSDSSFFFSFCMASHQRKRGLFQAAVEVWLFRDSPRCISISSICRLFHLFCFHQEASREQFDFFLNVRRILEVLTEFCREMWNGSIFPFFYQKNWPLEKHIWPGGWNIEPV